MNLIKFLQWGCVAGGFLLSSCSLKSGSIPSSLGILHDPQVTPEKSNQLEYATEGRADILGPGMLTDALNYRYGFSKNSEWRGTFSMIRWEFHQSEDYAAQIYLLNLNYKRSVNPNFAYWLGAGGGLSKYADLVSVQLGASLGYGNAYLIPYVATEAWISAPFNTRKYCHVDDAQDCDYASLTNGVGFDVGLKLNYFKNFKFGFEWGMDVAASSKDRFLVVGGGLSLGYVF